ncbi:hypothetical protein BD626DRAFT_516208, partial [Schizophyllum amplum]
SFLECSPRALLPPLHDCESSFQWTSAYANSPASLKQETRIFVQAVPRPSSNCLELAPASRADRPARKVPARKRQRRLHKARAV